MILLHGAPECRGDGCTTTPGLFSLKSLKEPAIPTSLSAPTHRALPPQQNGWPGLGSGCQPHTMRAAVGPVPADHSGFVTLAERSQENGEQYAFLLPPGWMLSTIP